MMDLACGKYPHEVYLASILDNASFTNRMRSQPTMMMTMMKPKNYLYPTMTTWVRTLNPQARKAT
jgi:hypothetical protein